MAIALGTVAIAGVFLGIRTTFGPHDGPVRLIFAFEAVDHRRPRLAVGNPRRRHRPRRRPGARQPDQPGLPAPGRSPRVPRRPRLPAPRPVRPPPERAGMTAATAARRRLHDRAGHQAEPRRDSSAMPRCSWSCWRACRPGATAATMKLLVEFFTLLALAQMWNLLAGYAGLVSIGQQAFIGLGAYGLFFVGLDRARPAARPRARARRVGDRARRPWPRRSSPSGSRAATSRSGRGSSPRSSGSSSSNTKEVGAGTGVTIQSLVAWSPRERRRLTYWLALRGRLRVDRRRRRSSCARGSAWRCGRSATDEVARPEPGRRRVPGEARGLPRRRRRLRRRRRGHLPEAAADPAQRRPSASSGRPG